MSYEEQIMSKDKYPSIFSPKMDSIVFIIPASNVFPNARSFQNWEYIYTICRLGGPYSEKL